MMLEALGADEDDEDDENDSVVLPSGGEVSLVYLMEKAKPESFLGAGVG